MKDIVLVGEGKLYGTSDRGSASQMGINADVTIYKLYKLINRKLGSDTIGLDTVN